MTDTKKIQALKDQLVLEITIAARNHFDIYIDSSFVADVRKSVDDLVDQILKTSNDVLMKR